MIAPALDSRIDAVTVFHRGARVTRIAEIRPQDGQFPPEVRIPGIPLAANDASFRVRVEADAHGESSSGCPVARDLRIALEAPEAVAEKKPPDERALAEARQEVARLEARVARIERELQHLADLPVAPRPSGKKGEPPPDSPTKARLALLDFRFESSERLAEELLEQREKKREAIERRDELEDRLRRASSDRQVKPHELRKTVVVQLGRDGDEVPSPPARLVIDYTVPGATWAPSYAVRLQTDGSEAEVAMRALVAQCSGEDWDRVRLTLSTARLDRWAELPKLPSLRIGRRQPVVAPLGWRPPPTGVEELYRDWDRAFADWQRKKGRSEPEAALELRQLTLECASSEIESAAEAATAGEETADLYLAGASKGAVFDLPPDGAMLVGASRPAATRRESRAARRRRQTEGELERLPTDALQEDAADRVLCARDEMLAYGTLRMPPARSGDRGHLVVTSQLRLYVEQLVEQEIRYSGLALEVGRAEDRAEHAGQTLPARHRRAASDDGFDYSYVAETPVDVPSDPHYHAIPIRKQRAAARLHRVAVPRESTEVYRVARFENPLPGPLLPGPADVSLGDEFLAATDVAATPSGAAVTLGLGVDQKVKISRNTHFREETTGLTRGSLGLAHEIAIDVQSHASHPVQLEVRERIPTTREHEKEVEVELGDVTPAWQPWVPEVEADVPLLKGGYRWQVDLEPGEKKELRAAYRVRIAAKHELVGGNRREPS